MAAVIDERIKPVLNAFPSIGWAILAAIWFEPGDFGVIFVEAAILIPFCLINIAEGLRDIDREVMEMGRSFTRHHVRIFWRLTLPLLVRRPASPMASPKRSRSWRIASRSECARLSDASRSDRRRQHHLPCHLIRHRAGLHTGERLLIVPLERRFERR
jgi:NitT/TauT family transport system permease protein/sulfonate transport system permease protein